MKCGNNGKVSTPSLESNAVPPDSDIAHLLPEASLSISFLLWISPALEAWTGSGEAETSS